MAISVLDDLRGIARVGFDHGWHLCGPTFLKLGIPLLLVDQLFLDDPVTYRLEPLGARNPRTLLPLSTLTVERSGRFVALTTTDDAQPLAIGAFADPTCLEHLDRTDVVAVTLADTWAVEQSWCALFRSFVGIAPVRRMSPRSG